MTQLVSQTKRCWPVMGCLQAKEVAKAEGRVRCEGHVRDWGREEGDWWQTAGAFTHWCFFLRSLRDLHVGTLRVRSVSWENGCGFFDGRLELQREGCPHNDQAHL